MPAEQWLIAMSVSTLFLAAYTFCLRFRINELEIYIDELEVELFEEVKKNNYFKT